MSLQDSTPQKQSYSIKQIFWGLIALENGSSNEQFIRIGLSAADVWTVLPSDYFEGWQDCVLDSVVYAATVTIEAAPWPVFELNEYNRPEYLIVHIPLETREYWLFKRDVLDAVIKAVE